MTISFTRLLFITLCFICLTFLLVVSCSKDVDALRDAVILEKEIILDNVSNDSSATTNSTPEDNVSMEDDLLGEPLEMESRLTVFPSIQDAYLQNGQGYDQTIIRLEENNRTSYLMFDLSAIDSIGGKITAVDLEFVINTDDGSGTIQVFKGKSNEWTENTLTSKTAPEAEVLLGSIVNEFFVDNKVRITLDNSQINPEPSTLVLDHKNGDDLAFASKENTTDFGPRLVVSYEAPVNAKILEIEIVQNLDEESVDPMPEETTEEETTEEETTEEETSEEETTEEETTEEETTEEETTEENTPTPEEDQNEAPIAIAEASMISGVAPLEVNFSGDKSSDDEGISTYAWNFKDGATVSNANTTHTFQNAGTYSVELTVTDSKGLSHTDTVVITVSAPINNAPVAIASANITSGPAPLLVNFTGSNSSDDNGIISYRWEFKDGSSSTEVNPSHTFNSPGTYYVDLFVTDAQGLTNFAGVTITVEEEVVVVDNSCVTNGGFANETGLKTWCWGDMSIPNSISSGGEGFSNGQLALNVECSANQVVRQGDRLKFTVNPTSPSPSNWCSNSYNLRSEIRTMPWNVDHPLGTEEWIGFSYGFGNNYKVDPTGNWIFYQAHEGTSGANPLISLQIDGRSGSPYQMGELVIVNSSQENHADNVIYSTNVVPTAGASVDIVLHIIWGDDNTGLLQVWLNGTKTLDIQTRTTRNSSGVGGNSKFGIYKGGWRSASGVQNSASNGVTSLETNMGALRIITRKPGDSGYGSNSYSTVAPR
jgi:PKD repeat protein